MLLWSVPSSAQHVGQFGVHDEPRRIPWVLGRLVHLRRQQPKLRRCDGERRFSSEVDEGVSLCMKCQSNHEREQKLHKMHPKLHRPTLAMRPRITDHMSPMRLWRGPPFYSLVVAHTPMLVDLLGCYVLAGRFVCGRAHAVQRDVGQ